MGKLNYNDAELLCRCRRIVKSDVSSAWCALFAGKASPAAWRPRMPCSQRRRCVSGAPNGNDIAALAEFLQQSANHNRV